MSDLELYCWLDVRQNILDKVPVRTYFVDRVSSTSPVFVYDSEREIAEKVVDRLFLQQRGEFLYTNVILYWSLDGDLKGKPQLIVSRDGIGSKGLSNESDVLAKVQECVVEVLRERNK